MTRSAHGACRHPIRLRGAVLRGDELVYSTAGDPDGALRVRWGNRREEGCLSCAYEYRGDMWQLIYAGLAGGRKGVPESVAEHPQVFATLTAPGFGAVHARRDDARRAAAGGGTRSMIPSWVAQSTRAYDYVAAVLWKWHAPALWDRFTVELVRVLAAAGRLNEAACRKLVRVAYAKIAEFQARGLVHFHAITRLDHPHDRANAPGLRVSGGRPGRRYPRGRQEHTVQGNAGGGEVLELRLGEQQQTRILADARDGEPLCPAPVAAYVAVYSCKGSHEQIARAGAAPEQPREGGSPEQLETRATCSWRPVSRRPSALPAKRSWSCASGHRTIGDEPARWCCGRRC